MASWNASKTRKITVAGLLSAVATVLMYLDFSVPVVPSFLKMDFSDLPALLASCALGPMYGAAVCLVKNVIHLLKSSSGGIGGLSNLILGLSFVIPAGWIYGKKPDWLGALMGGVAGAVLMAGLSVLSNYYIVYPIYYTFMPKDVVLQMYQALNPRVENMWQALLWFNMPFTFVKGMCSVLILMPLYKKLGILLRGDKK